MEEEPACICCELELELFEIWAGGLAGRPEGRMHAVAAPPTTAQNCDAAKHPRQAPERAPVKLILHLLNHAWLHCDGLALVALHASRERNGAIQSMRAAGVRHLVANKGGSAAHPAPQFYFA
jgi:hypothetical protein